MDAVVERLLPVAKAPPDVVVYLPGQPRGKSAGQATILKANPVKGRFKDRAMVLTDKKTRAYEAELKFAAEQVMTGRTLLDCALRCRVTAVFMVPRSWSKRDTEHALAGLIRPTSKPDDDNLLKCRDALKGVVFRDDALFVESTVRKFYGEKPCFQIEIWRFVGTML